MSFLLTFSKALDAVVACVDGAPHMTAPVECARGKLRTGDGDAGGVPSIAARVGGPVQQHKAFPQPWYEMKRPIPARSRWTFSVEVLFPMISSAGAISQRSGYLTVREGLNLFAFTVHSALS